jgi:hypothetical protein
VSSRSASNGGIERVMRADGSASDAIPPMTEGLRRELPPIVMAASCRRTRARTERHIRTTSSWSIVRSTIGLIPWEGEAQTVSSPKPLRFDAAALLLSKLKNAAPSGSLRFKISPRRANPDVAKGRRARVRRTNGMFAIGITADCRCGGANLPLGSIPPVTAEPDVIQTNRFAVKSGGSGTAGRPRARREAASLRALAGSSPPY